MRVQNQTHIFNNCQAMSIYKIYAPNPKTSDKLKSYYMIKSIELLFLRELTCDFYVKYYECQI